MADNIIERSGSVRHPDFKSVLNHKGFQAFSCGFIYFGLLAEPLRTATSKMGISPVIAETTVFLLVVATLLMRSTFCGARNLKRNFFPTTKDRQKHIRNLAAFLTNSPDGYPEPAPFERRDIDDVRSTTIGNLLAHANDIIEKPEYWEAQWDGLKNQFAPLPEFARITKSQLQHVIDRSEKASLDLSQGLGNVADLSTSFKSYIVDTAERVDHLSMSSSEERAFARKSFEDMERSCRVAGQLLAEERKKIAELTTLATHVVEKIQVIEHIAHTTTMLSFNSSIEAARAGQHGAGFVVIASEVRDLAKRTKEASLAIRDTASQLKTTLDTLSADESVEDALREKDAYTQAFSNAMQHLDSGYETLNDYVGKLVDEAKSQGDQIEASVYGSMGNLQFQDIIRQQLEAVQQSLTLIEEEQERLFEIADNPGADPDAFAHCRLSQIVTEMFENYVTQEQHDNHLSVTGEVQNSSETSDIKAIELF